MAWKGRARRGQKSRLPQAGNLLFAFLIYVPAGAA
jgi:hypothetical protein